MNLTPRFLKNLNAGLVIVWVCLLVPTIFWWHSSILWVGFISIWANVISHATMWNTGRVEVRTERMEWIQAVQEAKDRERDEAVASEIKRVEAQNLAMLHWLRRINERLDNK